MKIRRDKEKILRLCRALGAVSDFDGSAYNESEQKLKKASTRAFDRKVALHMKIVLIRPPRVLSPILRKVFGIVKSKKN